MRVDGDAKADDIALVMHTLSVDGGPEVALHSPQEIVAEPELGIFGGLLVSRDTKSILPSCCCDLQDWREWYSLLENEGSPWLGHTPSPWVERSTNGFTIWADGGDTASKPDVLRIEFSAEELANALRKVDQDLKEFASRLRLWSFMNAPACSDALASAVARAFHVSSPEIA